MMNRRAIKYTGLWLLLLSGVLSVVLTTAGCEEQPTPKAPAPTAQSDTPTPTAEHEHAAHLKIVAVDDIKALIAETAERDQVLIVDYWATWCAPCVEMFPSLHAGLVARGDSVRAVTVTLDDPSREPAAVEFLVEQDALHDAYIFKSDSAEQQKLADEIGEKWDNLNVPAILVYDAEGTLVGEFLDGGSTDDILAQVDSLLATGE